MKRIIHFALQHIPRKYMQRVGIAGIKASSVFYTGNRVECPVCERHFRKFLPYGYVTMRENALCPSCLALERHRLFWLFLKNETDFFTAPLKVLHIAPEPCFLKRLGKQKNLDYVTADYESPLARVKMDIQAIPFENETVDVIFCSHILEHVDDDRKALSELYRVMKKGGWGIIMCPVDETRENTYEDASITSPAEREKHFGQKDHLRIYGKDFGQRIAEAGFKVEALKYGNVLPEEIVRRCALSREETIYYIHKAD